MKLDFNHDFSTSMAFQASLVLMQTKTGVHFQLQEGKALQKVGMSKEKRKKTWKIKLVPFPDSQTLPFSKSCAKHSKEKGYTYCHI